MADAAQNAGLNLLYEPGNWGDVLKGAWAVAAAERLASQKREITYADPFAGAPWYPLVPAAAERLQNAPCEALRRLAAPHAAAGRWPSTAVLFRDGAASRGSSTGLLVFDLDADRREAWREVPAAQVLVATSGEEALSWIGAQPLPPDFLLVDPYDLLDHPTRRLEPALPLASRGLVLLYLYNRAPRGGGHERAYRSLRRAIADACPRGSRVLLGRLASDARLPRAFHEVILVGPAAEVEPLASSLEPLTRELAASVAAEGAFEAP